MKFTLDKKILAGFIACCLLLIGVAILSFQNSEKFLATNYWVNHTHQVLFELERILGSSVDAETGERGYIITGENNYLEPYLTSKKQLFLHLEKAKELTVDNPKQQKNLSELQQKLVVLSNRMEEVITARKTKGFAEAQQLIATDEGKLLLDDVRERLAKSVAMEDSLLREREIASREDTQSFSRVFIALLLVIAAVLLVVYAIISTNLKALRKADLENSNKNWNLTGSGELTKNLQGNKLIVELGQIVIDHLAGFLSAQVGAFYINEIDENGLKLIASHALDQRKAGTLIKLGEGIVGQAAISKKTVELSGVSKDYFNITTGFGEVVPRGIIAAPLIFENDVLGVIELGSMTGFTDLQKKFLPIVLDNIAIAIASAQSREKTKELLEETQRQAEELEAQQEELRQMNEELQEKTDLLEKSEAELKAQQEELQQSNEELEEKANLLETQKERLENSKNELQSKARELEVTSKYKSEFLANMSHELRTPLNSILILAQLLTENKSGVLGAKEVEFSRNIRNSGNDLLNLINEILDLSKVESGKMELDIAEVPLREVANDLTAMFTEIARNKQVTFKVLVDEETLRANVVSDKQRLEQILKNLLSNAFKFTPKGQNVTLKIEKYTGPKDFKNRNLNHVERLLKFSVIDTGIGIPVDKLGIIFEAFQQADGSTKRQYGGTGLGLSISRELANVLGGEILLESKEGKGSTFTFIMPYNYDAAIMNPGERKVEVKENKPAQQLMPAKRPLHPTEVQHIPDDRDSLTDADRLILIMEDDVFFAQILLDFVRERKYKGIVATQGNSGLSYARHYKPDAIILDMKMPVLDGADVLKRLKSDPELRHIPVQIISGYDRRKEGLELGAFDFLQKPIAKETLVKAFDRIESFVSKKLKKLLVIEDDETHNMAIKELIGNGDVKCFSAYSGNEAFQKLKEESFDCIILDLGLPDMTGFDFLEKIKADEQLRSVPVVVYTGKEVTREESNRLTKLANTVVLKTANSQERLLDETILFLHRIEARLPKDKQTLIRKLHKTDEVLKHKKVLVVDDDIRNIYSLTNALEEEGMECITAENGKIALDLMKDRDDIEIVLMDVMMPEMDGYETTRALRAQNKFAKLPIIALTAKAMKGDKEKCLDAGMSDYISKPVNVEQLLSLMRVWLYK